MTLKDLHVGAIVILAPNFSEIVLVLKIGNDYYNNYIIDNKCKIHKIYISSEDKILCTNKEI